MPTSAPGPALLRHWRRLSRLPAGRWLFNRLIGRMVPYTGSIHPEVETLEPGYAVVAMADRRAVRNHLRSIHAVALANLGEVTSGLAMITGLAPGIRSIVTRLTITFVRKARGRLVAEARVTIPEVNTVVEHDVSARIRDERGDVVAEVTVTWRLDRADRG